MGVKKRVQKKSFIKREVEEIIPVTTRIINYFSSNIKETLAGCSIFILIIASYFAWSVYSSNLEKKAQIIFTQAFKQYYLAVDKGNLKEYQNAVNQWQNLVTQYPRTSYGIQSLFYLGNCYFWLNDYSNAVKYFSLFLEKASKKEKLLRQFVYEGLGYASEQSGRYDQALEYFKKATEEGVSLNDSGLMNLARAYEELNQNDKAIEVYNRIVKEYPQSENANVARDKVLSLKTLPH